MLHPDMTEFRETAAQSREAMNRQRQALTRAFNSGLATAARVVGLNRPNLSYPALVGALDLAAEACAYPAGIARLEARGAKLLADLASGSKPEVAEDLVVILPAPADEGLETAFEARGLTCNTDRRRKGPTRHLWEGRAVAAEIAALVEPVGGVVNVVRTPQAPAATSPSPSAEPADSSAQSAVSSPEIGKDQNGIKSELAPGVRSKTSSRSKLGGEVDEGNLAAPGTRLAAPTPRTESMGEVIPTSSSPGIESALVRSDAASAPSSASAKAAPAVRATGTNVDVGAATGDSAGSVSPPRPQLAVGAVTAAKALPPAYARGEGAADQPPVGAPAKEMDGVAALLEENHNV